MLTQKTFHGGFVGGMLLLATVLLLFFYTIPTQHALSGLKENISALEQDLMLENGEKGAVEERNLSEIERNELDRAIPSKLEQNVLISDLNKMANASDVSFNALTFSLQQGAGAQVVNISAGFQGQSANIVRFMKMIEVNQRKLVVKDAGISRSESDNGLEMVNLNLTLQAFYRES